MSTVILDDDAPTLVELWRPHSPAGWLLAILAIALMAQLIIRGASQFFYVQEEPAKIEYSVEKAALIETCPVR